VISSDFILLLFRKDQDDYQNAGGFDVNDDEIEERRAQFAEMAQKSEKDFNTLK
jgi:hypothetical protein